MVEVSLTVGKLDASLALLLTKDHHLIEFPTILLPNGVKAGSIIKIKCDQDFQLEQQENERFQQIQKEILDQFASNSPQPPNLKIKNITQTSCVLEWDQLNLGTSNLKNLILFKDGKKLGSIPQPLNNKTTKLSGLPVDKTFKFQLRLDTTAGTYLSNEVEVTTHKMTDLSGITVCLGDLSPNTDHFTTNDIEETLKKMGAKFPPQNQVKVDTTHFLCTRENKQNPEYLKANEMNIPIIRPEWLKACERERRIVGVREFYVKDAVLPDIFARDYWGNKNKNKNEQPSVNPSINVTASDGTDIPHLDNVKKETEPVAESTPPPIEKDQPQEQVEDKPKEQEVKNESIAQDDVDNVENAENEENLVQNSDNQKQDGSKSDIESENFRSNSTNNIEQDEQKDEKDSVNQSDEVTKREDKNERSNMESDLSNVDLNETKIPSSIHRQPQEVIEKLEREGKVLPLHKHVTDLPIRAEVVNEKPTENLSTDDNQAKEFSIPKQPQDVIDKLEQEGKILPIHQHVKDLPIKEDAINAESNLDTEANENTDQAPKDKESLLKEELSENKSTKDGSLSKQESNEEESKESSTEPTPSPSKKNKKKNKNKKK